MPEAGPGNLEALAATLSWRFENRDTWLAALTHRSFVNESGDKAMPHNERLEFLGDALLDYVAASLLYERLPDSREGHLTALRAALVCEPALARYAQELELGELLRLGRGEDAGGGRKRPAVLCDVFEAVLGAALLDLGQAKATSLALRFLEPELERVLALEAIKDPRSEFQELVQRRLQITPSYRTVESWGPDHDKTFVVEALVDGEAWGRGEGSSKALAAKAAAEEALQREPAGEAQAGGRS